MEPELDFNQDIQNVELAINKLLANLLWLFDSTNAEHHEKHSNALIELVTANDGAAPIAIHLNKTAYEEKTQNASVAIMTNWAHNVCDPSSSRIGLITSEDPNVNLVKQIFVAFHKIEKQFFQQDAKDHKIGQNNVIDTIYENLKTDINRITHSESSAYDINPDQRRVEIAQARHNASRRVKFYIKSEINKIQLVKDKCHKFIHFVSENSMMDEDKSQSIIDIFGKNFYKYAFKDYCKPGHAEINLKATLPYIYLLKNFETYLEGKIVLLSMQLTIYEELANLELNPNHTLTPYRQMLVTASINAKNHIPILKDNVLALAQDHFFHDEMARNFLRDFSRLQSSYETNQNVMWHLNYFVQDRDFFGNRIEENFPLDLIEYMPYSARNSLIGLNFSLLDFLALDEIRFAIGNSRTELSRRYNASQFGNTSSMINEFERQLRVQYNFWKSQNKTRRIGPSLSKAKINNILLSRYVDFLGSYNTEQGFEFDENGYLQKVEKTIYYPRGKGFIYYPDIIEFQEETQSKKKKSNKSKQAGSSTNDASDTQNSIFIPENETLNIAKKYRRTPQSHEEYLKIYHDELIEAAREKHKRAVKELLDKQGRQSLTHGKFLKNNEIDVHQPLTMAMLTQETLSLFQFLSSSSKQATIIEFPQFAQQNYAKVAGGYGGESSYPTSGNSQNKTGKLIELSNYQSKPQSALQKTSNFLTSKNITGFERGAYGVAGAYHLVKMGYYAEHYIHALIQNARGQKSPLSNEEALTGLSTLGFWVIFWAGVSKVSLRLAGSAGVALMINDIVHFGQEKITKALLSYYGLDKHKSAISLDPKLTKIIQLQKAVENFQKNPSEAHRLKMILAFQNFLAPALAKVKTLMIVGKNKYVSLTPEFYNHDQEHYICNDKVFSLPKIYASKFVSHDKPLTKQNIQFSSIEIIDANNKTRFSKSYIGPEGELYRTYTEQIAAWNKYGQDPSDILDLAKTAGNLSHVQAEQLNYHLVLNKQDQTVKVMNFDKSYEVAKLVAENGVLKLVTSGDMQEFQSVKVDEFLKIANKTTQKTETLITPSKPYFMQLAYEQSKDFGPTLLPTLKAFSQTLYQQKMIDKGFHSFIQNTTPQEGYKIIYLIDLVSKKGLHLMRSPTFKYVVDKKKYNVSKKQLQKIALADFYYDHFHYGKMARHTTKPLIKQPIQNVLHIKKFR